MAITSSRNVQVQFSGDVTSNVIQSALDNVSAAGIENLVTLAIGANMISAPVVSGIVITGLTLIPPSGNTSLIVLKGVSGDTGIALHKTDPTSLALDTTFVSLILTVTV